MKFGEEVDRIKEQFSSFKKDLLDLREASKIAKDDALDTCEELAEVASEGLIWLKKEVDDLREYLKTRNEKEDKQPQCDQKES